MDSVDEIATVDVIQPQETATRDLAYFVLRQLIPMRQTLVEGIAWKVLHRSLVNQPFHERLPKPHCRYAPHRSISARIPILIS